MRHLWLSAIVLMVVVSASVGQQPKSSTKPPTSISGVLTGRSGKPLARARVFLGKVRR